MWLILSITLAFTTILSSSKWTLPNTCQIQPYIGGYQIHSPLVHFLELFFTTHYNCINFINYCMFFALVVFYFAQKMHNIIQFDVIIARSYTEMSCLYSFVITPKQHPHLGAHFPSVLTSHASNLPSHCPL